MDSDAFCQAARPFKGSNPASFGRESRGGQRLELARKDDRTVLVTVNAVTDATLRLDANHLLAVKELTFDLQLVGIV